MYTGRVHGRVPSVSTTVYAAVPSVFTVVYPAVYTARLRAVYTAVFWPCARPVHGPRVYAGRVHGLSNLSSLSNVHFTGWASYPSWVGVLPHSWGKTPTLSPLRRKRLAWKSKVISNSYFVTCEDMVYAHNPHNFLALCTNIRFENSEDVLRWASHPTLPYFYAVRPAEATKFGEITQNKGYYVVQGHSRSSNLIPIESSYVTSY